MKHLSEIRKVLEFYGKLDNYCAELKGDKTTPHFDFKHTPIHNEGYEKAKEALAKLDIVIKYQNQLEQLNIELLKFIKEDVWNETTYMCQKLELKADISTIATSVGFLRKEICELSIKNTAIKGD